MKVNVSVDLALIAEADLIEDQYNQSRAQATVKNAALAVHNSIVASNMSVDAAGIDTLCSIDAGSRMALLSKDGAIGKCVTLDKIEESIRATFKVKPHEDHFVWQADYTAIVIVPVVAKEIATSVRYIFDAHASDNVFFPKQEQPDHITTTSTCVVDDVEPVHPKSSSMSSSKSSSKFVGMRITRKDGSIFEVGESY